MKSERNQKVQAESRYYPYGVLGRGYVLNDEQRENLRPFVLKTLLLLLIPAALAMFVGLPYAIPAFLAVAIYHYTAEQRFLVGAQRTVRRRRVSEVLMSQAQAFSTGWLLFALAFLPPTTILCAWAAFRSLSSGETAEALHRASVAAILALCLLFYGGVARFKWSRPER
jgi:hypothetical protein